jgi:carbon starvation protein
MVNTLAKMDIRLVILLLFLIPVIAIGALFATGSMNTLWVVLVGGVMLYLIYTLYARRIDKEIIQSDAKKATPAKMYMDGVDFMPTNRNVLYGYHFKSITAAGPITGVILAASIWGWLPAILWLILGVTFIGWASDYSAIMLSVRNDGNSLSAIAYRLIAPRTRTVLFVFIFFYLLVVAGAFLGLLTAVLAARPDTPFGIVVLAIMALLAGQMLYKWKMDLIVVTAVTVILTLVAMGLGPLGVDLTKSPTPWSQGPVSGAVVALNGAVDSLTGNQAVMSIVDPTAFDPRVPAAVNGVRPTTALYDAATGAIKTMPSYIFWGLLLLVFCYLGSNLPIWRFAQPVNYIGFWITLIVIVLSALGAVLAPFLSPKDSTFVLAPIVKPDFGFGFVAGKAYFPLWPMLFVTIACGAISGWHSLIGSVNTSRQIELETDALPVGGGGMLSENGVGLMSLIAASITGVTGAGAFAAGMGKMMGVLFGAASVPFGTAIAYGTFVVIVITVTQLIFRVMRVTLTEWIGDTVPAFKNVTVSTVFSMLLTFFLVLTSTFVYLYQLFGASNQLMAALGLLLVTIWLRSTKRNPLYAGIPMIFMYVTTMVALLVNAYNQWVNVLTAPAFQGQLVVQIGGWFMLLVSALLFVAAAFIAWDGWKAWQRYGAKPQAATAPAE